MENFNISQSITFQLFSLLNFKWSPFYLPESIPYDCQSIMHYREDAFAKNKGLTTITARDPDRCDLTCPSYKPRPADVRLLRLKYKCKKKQKYQPKYRNKVP